MRTFSSNLALIRTIILLSLPLFDDLFYSFTFPLCSLQSHDDYQGIVKAKEAMIDVSQYINEVKRDSDILQIMRDIQVTICFCRKKKGLTVV